MVLSKTSHNVIESHSDRTSNIEFWENRIVFIKIKDNVNIEFEDAQQQFLLLKSKYNGIKKHLVLVETGNDTSISKEAREFSAKPESNEMTSAMAVIVQSLAQRIVINFIIKFTRQQTMKMKLFDDKQKGIDWLLTHK
jgi:hypothetical protein